MPAPLAAEVKQMGTVAFAQRALERRVQLLGRDGPVLLR